MRCHSYTTSGQYCRKHQVPVDTSYLLICSLQTYTQSTSQTLVKPMNTYHSNSVISCIQCSTISSKQCSAMELTWALIHDTLASDRYRTWCSDIIKCCSDQSYTTHDYDTSENILIFDHKKWKLCEIAESRPTGIKAGLYTTENARYISVTAYCMTVS